MLTKKEYGIQYSREQLRSYIADEMDVIYKQSASWIGSEDSYMPRGIKYSLRANVNGAQRHMMNVEAMVSSIFNVADLLKRQTSEYQQKVQKQQQQRQQTSQNEWSSERISEYLNIDNDEDEGVEGSLFFQYGRIQRLFAFDNKTIEKLPESKYNILLFKEVNTQFSIFISYC